MTISALTEFLIADPVRLVSLAVQLLLLPIGALALARRWRDRPERAHAVLVASAATMLIALAATVLAAWGELGVFAATPIELAPGSAATASDASSAPAAASGFAAIALTAILTLGALLWAGSSIRLLARTVYGVRAARRLVARSAPCAREVDRIAASSLGENDRVRVVESAELAVPVACGWSTPPAIVLPSDARGLRAGELRAILLHERAHLRRADHVSAIVFDLLVAVLPWHPLVRAMRRNAETMAEHCCDADVLASGLDAADYARTLFTVARGEPSRPALAALGMGTVLADRIGRLLDAPRPHRVRHGVVARATLLACACLGGVLLAVTQTAPARPVLPPGVDAATLQRAPVHLVARTIDFGRVAPASDSRATLELVNLGDRTVRAIDVQAGCGCTTIEAFEARDLAPGERLRVPFTIRAPEASGREHVRGVTFAFEGQDPIEATLRLVTSGDPTPDPITDPDSVTPSESSAESREASRSAWVGPSTT